MKVMKVNGGFDVMFEMHYYPEQIVATVGLHSGTVTQTCSKFLAKQIKAIKKWVLKIKVKRFHIPFNSIFYGNSPLHLKSIRWLIMSQLMVYNV